MPALAKYTASITRTDEIKPKFELALRHLKMGSDIFPAQWLQDLRVCFVEAIANAIKHAHELKKKGKIDFTIKLSAKAVVIEVIDHGPGFEPRSIKVPDFEQFDESGRGLFIMRQLMDRVTYTRSGPNRLIMQRSLPVFTYISQEMDLLNNLSRLFSFHQSKSANAFDLILNHVVEVFGVERASVMLYDSRNKKLKIKASHGLDDSIKNGVEVKPGEGIAGFSFQHAKACLVSNIDKNKSGWEKKSSYKTKSLICAPFFDPENLQKPLGVINVTERISGKAFGPKDKELLTHLANQLTLSLAVARLRDSHEKARELSREFKIASQIQKSLLPQEDLMDSFKLKAWLENASMMGGDFYDVISLDANKSYICIADVSGHNIAAAMTLVNCRGHLRALASKALPPAVLLSELNTLLYEDLTKNNQFISLLLMQWNKKNHTLQVASAGHEAPWHFRGTKSYSLAESIPANLLLGLEQKVTYDTYSLKLQKGDTLLLYTDGLPEVRNGKGFILGRMVLYDFLKKQTKSNATKLLKSIQSFVSSYKKQTPLHDDITVLTLDF